MIVAVARLAVMHGHAATNVTQEATESLANAPGCREIIASSATDDTASEFMIVARWDDERALQTWNANTCSNSFRVAGTTTMPAVIKHAPPLTAEALSLADNDQLHALNNELAVLARENARKGRELHRAKAELQAALDELKDSYWHLRKIAEVLPMCAVCGKVNPGRGDWETVVEYLRHNSLFLSHGYCPDCEREVRANLESEVQ